VPDYQRVGCEQVREALSAQLDGEDTPGEAALADEHMAGCAACRTWWEAAAAVTRLARTGGAAPLPELPDSLLDAAPGPGRARLVAVLWALLGGLGVVQLVLGLAQVTGFAATAYLHEGHLVGATSVGHLWHEAAAWNVAVGAGFVWIAMRRSRPAGMVPMLTAFVAVLVLLSVSDAVLGRVEAGRLLSHGFIVAGYLVILALTRPALDFGDPSGPRGQGSSWWRVRFDETDEERTDPAVMPRPVEGAARHRRAA
jgi:predicted anti-sigma-YlaC factor YlaD